jgi:hypothetical protein
VKRSVDSPWYAFVGLTVSTALSLQPCAGLAAQRTDPILLRLTFVKSTPVTTVTVLAELLASEARSED